MTDFPCQSATVRCFKVICRNIARVYTVNILVYSINHTTGSDFACDDFDGGLEVCNCINKSLFCSINFLQVRRCVFTVILQELISRTIVENNFVAVCIRVLIAKSLNQSSVSISFGHIADNGIVAGICKDGFCDCRQRRKICEGTGFFRGFRFEQKLVLRLHKRILSIKYF